MSALASCAAPAYNNDTPWDDPTGGIGSRLGLTRGRMRAVNSRHPPEVQSYYCDHPKSNTKQIGKMVDRALDGLDRELVRISEQGDCGYPVDGRIHLANGLLGQADS